MSYVTEIKLNGGRGGWSGSASSSCPEVDLEVIEEYLQEHSLEVQPAHTPLTTMGQQAHAHSHRDTRIIGSLEDGGGGGLCVECRCVFFYLTGAHVLLSTENSWSGQHAYKWHCGSQTPNKEYKELVPHPAWLSPHNNQWVSTKL